MSGVGIVQLNWSSNNDVCLLRFQMMTYDYILNCKLMQIKCRGFGALSFLNMWMNNNTKSQVLKNLKSFSSLYIFVGFKNV